MGFSRQEYCNGLPFPSPGDLPGSGIKPMWPALAGGFFTTEPPGKPSSNCLHDYKLNKRTVVLSHYKQIEKKGYNVPVINNTSSSMYDMMTIANPATKYIGKLLWE